MTLPIIALLFFFAISLGLIAFYMGYITVKTSPYYAVKKRLRELAIKSDEKLSSDLSIEVLKEMSPVDKFLSRFKLIRKLNDLIDQAGLNIDTKFFIMIMIIYALFGLVIGIALQRGIVFPLLFFVIGISIPLLYLHKKKIDRSNAFTEQLPNSLDMIARSLRAGHSLSSAIQIVGSESPEPTAGLFKAVYEEQTLGLSLIDALTRMLERMPSMDLRLFVTSVSIHKEVGGNLAEMLEKLGNTIRERIRIKRQIKVYTAQGRLSGYILAALPIFMAVMLYFIAPDYIMELVEVTTGRYAIGIAVTAQIIGFLVIRRLINIKI